MLRPESLRLHVLVVAFCMPGLLGCSAGSREDRVTYANDARILDLLLARDEPTYDRVFVEEEIAKCMQAEGFDYQIEIVDVGTESSDDFLSREYREVSGFGIADSRSPSTSADELMTPSSNDEALASLDGPGLEKWAEQEQGCFDEAWSTVERLRGDVLERVAGEISTEELLGLGLRTAPEFETAMEAWATCMNAAGFPYSSQFEMYLALEDEIGSLDSSNTSMLSAFRSQEIATALADLDCEESHLRAKIDEVETQMEQRLRAIVGGDVFEN